MKLRIYGTSIRFRLLRSEVAKLVQTGRISETIHFSDDDHGSFTYALECESATGDVELRYKQAEIVAVLPRAIAVSWAETEQVGIYAKVEIGRYGALDILVEKDFACLDLSDAENQDTFPNPLSNSVC
jgi:hypothetical protein